MGTNPTHITLSGNRRGFLYATGEEARRFDLVRYRKDSRLAIVHAVNRNGRLAVRWVDSSTQMIKSARIKPESVDLTRRDARKSEVVA